MDLGVVFYLMAGYTVLVFLLIWLASKILP
jgi:hypothetical protein